MKKKKKHRQDHCIQCSVSFAAAAVLRVSHSVWLLQEQNSPAPQQSTTGPTTVWPPHQHSDTHLYILYISALKPSTSLSGQQTSPVWGLGYGASVGSSVWHT